jgi:hypothetical protein
MMDNQHDQTREMEPPPTKTSRQPPKQTACATQEPLVTTILPPPHRRQVAAARSQPMAARSLWGHHRPAVKEKKNYECTPFSYNGEVLVINFVLYLVLHKEALHQARAYSPTNSKGEICLPMPEQT